VRARKIRGRYTKTGKLRFVSAIDLGRIWERALRRADLPIAYSEGFTPHPKVSFPDALPLGYASTGEYVELTFAVPVDVERLTATVNPAFPDGIALISAVAVPAGKSRLAKLLRASLWQLDYPQAAAPAGLAQALSAAMAADRLRVERERKGEVSTVDLRPTIHDLFQTDRTVRAVLHHSEPQCRPSELHQALAGLVGGLPEPSLVTRVAQGQPADSGLSEALSGDLVTTAPQPESEHRDQRLTAAPTPHTNTNRSTRPARPDHQTTTGRQPAT
jgi:radical SAM-linked protein